MRHIKKALSLMLVFCMIFSLTTSAFAAEMNTETQMESAQETLEETTSTEETSADVAGDETFLSTEETETQMETEKTSEETEGVEVTALEDEGVAPASITISTKPADGTTTNGQPFASGTGGSTNFRIPSLVTLSDGTLVAAADARWDTTSDGYGLDTIVSRSTDNGATWNYTFANYLGDNGNVSNGDSTAFIDPAMVVTSDDTIYMLVDLYPHGTYISNVQAGTGFDGNGHLLLRATDGTSYDYYVGDFTNGTASIYQTNGIVVDGYTVDAYYNIESTDGSVNTNLFFSDSPYQVLSTSYLYLTSSTDDGATWSAPTMLNSQVKDSSDKFYGVGPGTGLVTTLDDGTERIMFACYTYAGQDGNTSVIYSDDKGKIWTRSVNIPDQTSEATMVEADGNIYMFTRHGGYYVSTDHGETWGGKQDVEGEDISYTTTCQLNALTYSQKIDGKTAILLSAPTSGRTTGKIFVGLVQDDGSISWKYTYQVNSGTYQYSCMAELFDKSIGLLYESGSAAITYTNLAIETIASGATIGETTTEPTDPTDPAEPDEGNVTATVNVDLYVGQTYETTDTTGDYESSYTGAGLETSIATVEVNGTTTGGTEATEAKTDKVSSITSGSEYIIGNGTQWLTFNGSTISSTTNPAEATKWTVTGSGNSYYIKSGSYYLRHNNGLSASTTNRNNTWSYSSSTGFYYTSGRSTYYLRLNGSTWQVSTMNSSNGTAYTYTPAQAATPGTASTSIKITGVAAGTTSVVVGSTKYNITVKEVPPIVDLGTTPFIALTGDATNGNYGKKITKLTTSVGLTFAVGLNVSGTDVEWSIADSSIATVDQNGQVKGVSAGETTLTATVDGVSYTMPVVIRQDTTSSSTKIIDIYISEITSTSVYYSVNCSKDLVQVQEGEAIYISVGRNSNAAIDFFGAPDEGYALTYLSSTTGKGDYMALNSTDPTQTDFYTKTDAAGANQVGVFGETAVQNMIQAALNKDCDGGLGFTRDSSNTAGIPSVLTFRSEKLPTVEKTVIGILGIGGTKDDYREYTEGMTAVAGETVYFKVTVQKYAVLNENNSIAYTNAILTDNLSDAVFYDDNKIFKDITEALTSDGISASTHEYYVKYTITDADLDTTITNTVDLSYTYQSKYSSGSFDSSANAEAQISAVSFTPNDIVVDFGLPVTMDYSDEAAHGRYNLVSGTSSTGVADVTVADNKVTYTPSQVLTDIDTVTLVNEKGLSYTFKVYPATTVYYEEGFAVMNGFTGGSKGSGTQATQVAGLSSDAYGYDAKYTAENAGPSNGTQAVSTAANDTATLTFTGTGIAVYTNNTTDTGNLMAKLYLVNEDGTIKLKKSILVETAMKDGTTGVTTGQAGNAFNTPDIVLTGLGYANYQLVITNVNISADVEAKTINLDGFRVYGTLEDQANAVYKADLEDSPVFIELRDQVLASLNAEAENSGKGIYAKQIAGNLYSQIYATGSKNGAVIIIPEGIYSDENLQDLLDNGPKNEIYLMPGQVLTFKVDTTRQVQIGLKSVAANASCTINGEDMQLNSSTDMFYRVEAGRIIVTNTGNTIVSITLVKICDDPNASLGTLTEDDITAALVSLGYTESGETTDPVEPTYADATLNVVLNAADGSELASTSLTANGVAGEVKTFAAEDIEAAVNDLVPDGYELQDAAYGDVEVAYGESERAVFTAVQTPEETETETETESESESESESETEPSVTPDQPTNIFQQLISAVKDIFKGLFGRG